VNGLLDISCYKRRSPSEDRAVLGTYVDSETPAIVTGLSKGSFSSPFDYPLVSLVVVKWFSDGENYVLKGMISIGILRKLKRF